MKFRTMTPNFSVENVAETTEFYQKELGFKIQMARRTDTDTIESTLIKSKEYSYVMVRRDDLYIMFVKNAIFEENILNSGEVPCGASVLFYIDVERVDDVYNELKKNHVEVIKELSTTWYGRREFYIKDCNGYILAFGEHL